MGRQINYYATSQDMKELLEHIKLINGIIIDQRGEILTEYDLDIITDRLFLMNKFGDVTLYIATNESRIDYGIRKDGTRYINTPFSDTIEFTPSGNHHSGHFEECPGQLYISTDVYQRSEQIRKMYNSISRFIKTRYKLSDEKYFYIGKDAYRLYNEGLFYVPFDSFDGITIDMKRVEVIRVSFSKNSLLDFLGFIYQNNGYLISEEGDVLPFNLINNVLYDERYFDPKRFYSSIITTSNSKIVFNKFKYKKVIQMNNSEYIHLNAGINSIFYDCKVSIYRNENSEICVLFDKVKEYFNSNYVKPKHWPSMVRKDEIELYKRNCSILLI